MPEITTYELDWNTKTHTGAIRAQFDDGPVEFAPVETAEEWIALALILSKAPVSYDPTTGIVTTGPRPAGT